MRVEDFWRPSGARFCFGMLRLGDIYAMRPRPSNSVKIKSCFDKSFQDRRLAGPASAWRASGACRASIYALACCVWVTFTKRDRDRANQASASRVSRFFIREFPGLPPSGSRERVEDVWRPSGARLRFGMLGLGDINETRPRPSKSIDGRSVV